MENKPKGIGMPSRMCRVCLFAMEGGGRSVGSHQDGILAVCGPPTDPEISDPWTTPHTCIASCQPGTVGLTEAAESQRCRASLGKVGQRFVLDPAAVGTCRFNCNVSATSRLPAGLSAV